MSDSAKKRLDDWQRQVEQAAVKVENSYQKLLANCPCSSCAIFREEKIKKN